MIRGEKYYFFRLDRTFNDPYPEYRIAKSFDELKLRFGHLYMSQFQFVCQMNEVIAEHLRAIEEFLISQLS